MTPAPLPLRDYTLTYRATGLSALNRRELRDGVRRSPADSLFLHFWGRLLRPGWEPGEFGNDLANWAAGSLHDLVLAERLALIDPRRLDGVEALRTHVLQVLEERLEEPSAVPAEARDGEAFHFLVAHVVVYDTGRAATSPRHLLDLLPELSPTTLLRHFVEAPGSPVHAGGELRAWLERFGPEGEELARQLASVDLFLHDEEELRERLVEMARATLGPGSTNGREGGA